MIGRTKNYFRVMKNLGKIIHRKNRTQNVHIANNISKLYHKRLENKYNNVTSLLTYGGYYGEIQGDYI
jgi:hypothetical protein